MKKVLSVLLAAAMVMGMSVSAFAADYAVNSSTAISTTEVEDLDFRSEMWVYRGKKVIRVDDDGVVVAHNHNNLPKGVEVGDDFGFEPGDKLYFYIMEGATPYTDVIDSDWYITLKSNGYVKDAYFTTQDKMLGTTKAVDIDEKGSDDKYRKMVCIELKDDFDNLTATNVNFYLTIVDDETREQSVGLSFKLGFDNAKEEYVSFKFVNDADHAAKWIVDEEAKGTAYFNFNTGSAYVTVNMIPEEKVILNLSEAYDKDIDKAYNEFDADLDFYNFKGTKDEFTKTATLFIPADDDTFIYEIVDEELVEVEAEYVEDYEFAKDGNKMDGWVIETKELGYYVVADEELVVAEEEVVEEVETPSTDKANPETGANDFVGAAVALAVVSVAAAGALALKK